MGKRRAGENGCGSMGVLKMRNAIVVMSCVFLVLLFIHVLIEYGINFADEASTLVSLGKDLFGFALAVTVLFYFLLGRDKARPAA